MLKEMPFAFILNESIDQMLKIPAEFRIPAKILVWGIAVVSIVVSFFTLPPVVSLPLALLGLAIPWFVSQLVFEQKILWVMPPLSAKSERNRLGTIWFNESVAGKEFVGLGLLYEDEEWARDAYRTIKSWNFGRLIDDHGNINVSVVAEGDHKYSMFVYPGHRPHGEQTIRDDFLAQQPANTEASIARLFYITRTCADYATRPEVEATVTSLKLRNKILLNTLYCVGDDVKPCSQRSFQINQFRFLDRADLEPNCPERGLQWFDGRKKSPETARRTDQLAKKMFKR